jgi:hypothetical protein
MSFNQTFQDEVSFEQAQALFRTGHAKPQKKRVIEKRKKTIAALQRAKK